MPPYSFWLKTSKLPVEELQAQGAGVGAHPESPGTVSWLSAHGIIKIRGPSRSATSC